MLQAIVSTFSGHLLSRLRGTQMDSSFLGSNLVKLGLIAQVVIVFLYVVLHRKNVKMQGCVCRSFIIDN